MSKHIDNILKLLSSGDYKPATDSELKRHLKIKKHENKSFYKDLKKLRKQGRVRKIGQNRYVLSSKSIVQNLFSGILKRKEGGYFISTAEGDYRLPRLINRLYALPGDDVVVSINKKKYGFVAEIVKVSRRKYKTVVGYAYLKRGEWFLESSDRKVDFAIALKNAGEFDLTERCVVLCDIAAYPIGRRKAEGKIVKIYGDEFDSAIDESIVIDKYNLPHIFSDDAADELKNINMPSDADFEAREDFRGLQTITIDGEDAKDFDDAIDIEKIKNGFRLYVHIADVSYYVKQNGFLDKEAYIRGFSVYFPGSVIPMLPHKLSDDICSLVPGEDRLSISVIMDIDYKGNVVKYKFTKSVIRNKNRMTYKEVENILSNKTACDETLRLKLLDMKKLAEILRKKRFKNGSIDLNIPEGEFALKNGKIIDIKEKPRLFSHFLIEEFMLAANLCSADFLSKHFGAFIRRVHEEPDVKKIYILSAFLKRFGIKAGFDKNNITSKEIQKLMESIKDEKTKKIVSYLVLRSLKRAEYSIDNKRHFALNFDNYTHFTSPIRRYADLVTHRMIKSILDDKNQSFEELSFLVSGIREREIITEEAEFYMDDVKSAAFMADYIGEKFTGTIVGMISSGIFVRLDRYFVEGFIACERMKDDYYEYYEELFAMIGKRKKKVYKIGDAVEVVPVSVNKFAGEIDFVFA